uniref:Interleukin-11 n=1 Tax=Hippocampus comes TaxID=109280 RepID=A0A3Q3DPX7_HIPCM
MTHRHHQCGVFSWAVIHDSFFCLLRLLLLMGLLRSGQCRPAHDDVFCKALKSAVHQIDAIRETAEQLQLVVTTILPLLLVLLPSSCPSIYTQSCASFVCLSLQANKYLSQLYMHTLALRMHVEWLKAATESVSLPSEAAGAAGVHLLQLASLIRTALIQIDAVALPPPRSSLPTVSSAFDVLRYSVEMSRSLKVFCHWSKRLVSNLFGGGCRRD